MQKTKFFSLLLLAVTTCVCLTGCGIPLNVAILYERDSWARNLPISASRFTYEINFNSGWTFERVYDATYESISEKMDNYSQIQCQVKHKWRSNKFIIKSISFVVKTETDCNIDFTINNNNFYAESLDIAFTAGECQKVIFPVNLLGNKAFDNIKDYNYNTAFDICSYKLVKLDYWEKGDHWAADIIGQKYDWVLKDPTVKFTILDIQMEIERVK